MRKADGFPEVARFALEVASGTISAVAASAFWAWLSAGLKKHPERITIDRTTVEFEEGAIKRIVMERIESGGNRPRES